MPFSDAELEKYYAYARLLAAKLPKRDPGARLSLDDDVALEYYRLQKINEGSITLEKDSDTPLHPSSEAGIREEKDEQALLSEIIALFNDRFGAEFTTADRLFFDQIEETLVTDEILAQQAQNNTKNNFKYGFDDAFLNALIARMDQNQDIFARILDDAEFGALVRTWMLDKVYQRLHVNP